jgi:four helix bundle protein
MALSSFKDLIVWQKSMVLVKSVYALTRELPKEEAYGLSSQIRRSAISIPSNIAEGSKRGTSKDYVQFLKIAYGSSAELETQLIIIQDIYPEVQNTKDALVLCDEVQKMLSTIIKKIK